MPRKAELAKEYMHPLIYADPGAGKTVLAGTSPNALIIHPPEDNFGSALRMGHKFDEETVRDWSEMAAIYDYLRHEKHGYKWVWWDGISLGQDELLHGIMLDTVAEKPHREIEIPDKREYLMNFDRIKTWVRNMIALPINFGITAHPYRFEVPDPESDDPDDINILYMPWVQGKQMPEKICGYMNIVGYLDVQQGTDGKEHRVLYTAKRKLFYAKDQFGAFNGRIIDPTIPQMERMVRSKEKETLTPEETPEKSTVRRPVRKPRSS